LVPRKKGIKPELGVNLGRIKKGIKMLFSILTGERFFGVKHQFG